MRKWPIFLLLAIGPAHAEFFTGNDLYEKMRSRDTSDHLQAMMYVAGVSDAHQGVITCAPRDVTLGQVFDLVKNYLERHPEQRNRSGDAVIASAMRPVWPCRTRSGT